MAGLFGGTGNKFVTPTYTSLQLQTAVQGLPIPILWGGNRLSANVIDCFDFYSQPAGKGKGGKSGDNDYFAAVILALCEGASEGFTTTVGQAWSDGQEINFADLGFGFYPGNSTQEPWSTAEAAGRGLSYAYTAYLANGNLALGPSATIPNYNYEIFSTFNGYHVDNAATGLPDANFGDIIPDFLTNPRYTLNMPASTLDMDSFATLTTYQLAAGIFVSPLLKDQEQVSSILQRWGTIGNFWPFWNGTLLKVVCLGDTDIIDHNGVSYIPNVTPIYDLGPDDFQTADKNSNKSSAPVTVTRKDPADGYNMVQLNCSIRGNQYQNTPYRWSDQTSIDQVGVQAPNVISCTEICNTATAGNVVSLIGQRQLYIRNDYAFKLLPTFILLEPGDIVTLTEPNIGLDMFPVRIKSVDEDDKGMLSFTAEEFPQGVGTANVQEFEPWAGGEPWNVNVDPLPINAPAFIVPDPSLTQGQAEVWAALSWGENTGGCGVFLSFDGLNYVELGTTESNSLQGSLTAAVTEVSGLDLLNTLAIDLTESLGVIPTGATEQDAQTYRTLVLVDDELMAYGSVVPTGDYTANLTYLERGIYGTAPAAHAAGAAFARFDPTLVFQYPIQAQYLGVELYFKFPTANTFGNNAQTLAECVEYNYTPSNAPAPTNVGLTYNYLGPEGGTPPLTAEVDAVLSCTQNQNFDSGNFGARWSKYPAGTGGQVYGTATISNPGTISFSTLSASGDGYNYLSLRAENADGVPISEWSADAGNNTIPPPTSFAAVNSFSNSGTWLGVNCSWTAPSGGSTPTGYVINNASYNNNPLATITGGAITSYTIPPSAFVGDGFGPAFLTISMQAVYGSVNSQATECIDVAGTTLITSGLTGAGAGTGNVVLSWGANVAGTAFYRAFYWYSGFVGHQDFDAPLAECTVTGLTSGQPYTLAVVTYNDAGTAEVFVAGLPTISEQVIITPS